MYGEEEHDVLHVHCMEFMP